MDLLKEILSGKDPEKKKNGYVSHLFDWETGKFPLPNKQWQDSDVREKETRIISPSKHQLFLQLSAWAQQSHNKNNSCVSVIL